jgi:phosphatidylserine/phosphatidylglycerophosphate/cardiolipin synthase-like enzyme
MTSISAWLHSNEPPNLISSPFILVGSTSLLSDFFKRVAQIDEPGELWICAPFIDAAVAQSIPALGSLRHSSIRAMVVTADQANAENAASALTGYSWQQITINIRRALHAKIYAFKSINHSNLALVGSHNFTASGSLRNIESGVLLSSKPGTDVAAAISCILDHLSELQRVSETTPPPILATRRQF